MKTRYLRLVNRKVLPIFLATALIFNVTAQAVAQSVSLEELKKQHNKEIDSVLRKHWDEMRHDKRLQDTQWAQYSFNLANQQEQDFNKNGDIFYNASLKDPVIRRAEEINYLILGKGQKDTKVDPPLSKQQFANQYLSTLKTQRATALNDVKKDREKQMKVLQGMAEGYLAMGQYDEAAVKNWLQQSYDKLDKWVLETNEKLANAYKAEAAKTSSKYSEYIKDYNSARKEAEQKSFLILKKLVNELFALYNKDHAKVKPYLLKLMPMLAVVRVHGQKLFTQSQEDFLLNLYKKTLQEKENFCTKNISCDSQINAIFGIATFGKYENDGRVIKDFIIKNYANKEAVRILLSGVGALLAMKQYDVLRSLLIEADKKENDIGSIDLLSLSTPVQMFAVIRGQYLGEFSKYYQYQTEDGAVSNAWSDVAAMLAQDGSSNSLDMLKTFGVQKCRVIIEKKVNMKDSFVLSCGGIKPFLTGALLSGKSGINNYALRVDMPGSTYLNGDGRGGVITQEESNRQASVARAAVINMDAFARQAGLSRAALFARELINSGMGDINTAAEKNLDISLQNKFNIPATQLNHYAVVDSERISAKASRERRKQGFSDIAQLADVAIMVWCVWDLSRLAYKGLRGLTRVGNQIWKGVKVARMGSEVERAAYLRGHIEVFRQIRAREVAFAKYTTKIKNAMEPVVMGQRALYTSAPLPMAALISAERTNTVGTALKAASFDAAAGAYTINMKAAYQEAYGHPNRVADLQKTKNLLQVAATDASTKYQNKNLLQKFKSYRSFLADATEQQFALAKDMTPYQKSQGYAFAQKVRADKNAVFDKEIFSAQQKEMGIKFMSTRPAVAAGSKDIELFYEEGDGIAKALPVEVTIEGKIPSVKTKDLTKLLMQKKDEGYWLKFVNGENKLIDPSFFKIGIKQESMPALIKAARATELDAPLVLKFMPEEKGLKSFFTSSVPDFFKPKSQLWGGKGYVLVRDGSKFRKTNVHLQTSSRYDGLRAILEQDGTFTFMGKNRNLLLNEYNFALPKNQINTFMKLMPAADFKNPVQLSLLGGRNKINSLFFVTAISLSAASTGLVGPLQKSYGDKITPEQTYMISVILPYAASLLSPVISPFVKRFGAINVLKASMGTAVLSLAVPVFFGFNGFNNVIAQNDNKPSIMPLLISAGLIGISASLTRSSFNPLMNAVGGGGNLLKSMAFKNLSSFALILPPFLSSVADFAHPRYMKDTDGNIMTNAKGEQVTKPWTDFSLAYPVLAGVTGTSLFFLQRARLSRAIGRVEGYSFAQGISGIAKKSWFGSHLPTVSKGFNAVWKPSAGITTETFRSLRTMGNKAVLPIVLGSTAILGAEASLVNSYSMSEANKYLSDNVKIPTFLPWTLMALPAAGLLKTEKMSKALGLGKAISYKNWLLGTAPFAAMGGYMVSKDYNLQIASPVVPVVATVAMSAAPFLVRYKSKNILKLLGGEKNPMAYKKLLFASLATAGAGAYTLHSQDNMWMFGLGMSLTAAGFASTTNTFLKIGRFNLEAAGAAKSLITSFDVVYPGVHIGMAFVPKIYSKVVTDNVESMGIQDAKEKDYAKRKEHQNSMWIPIASWGIGTTFALKGVGLLPKLKPLPVGTVGAAKLLLGGENYFNPAPKLNGLGEFNTSVPALHYNLLDGFKAPSATPFMQNSLNGINFKAALQKAAAPAQQEAEDNK